MSELKFDPDLIDSLNSIRGEVRQLFQHLRLRSEAGDCSGRERLERVPALAKNNFANLTSPSKNLADVQAWRLISFLEGTSDGQLSALAREALRPIELDQKMGSLRSSDRWKEAAARLRVALGVGPAAPLPDAPPENCSGAPAKDAEAMALPAPAAPASRPGEAHSMHWVRSRWGLGGLAIAALAFVLSAIAGILWWTEPEKDVRYACLALEEASESDRAAHFAVSPPPVVARQPSGQEARTTVFPISDANGGPARSIWTTSKFSYAEGTKPTGPGGGKADFRLRVGGWGDTYLTLLQVPIPTNHVVRKAVIRLTVLGDFGDSRPTTMTLRTIADRWQVGSGPNDRLWWRDCPRSSALRNHLPAPGPRYSTYDIDITDLYNFWALAGQDPNGIILEPEEIGSWGPGRRRFSNFNTFYSTRARDVANRPQLILTY